MSLLHCMRENPAQMQTVYSVDFCTWLFGCPSGVCLSVLQWKLSRQHIYGHEDVLWTATLRCSSTDTSFVSNTTHKWLHCFLFVDTIFSAPWPGIYCSWIIIDATTDTQFDVEHSIDNDNNNAIICYGQFHSNRWSIAVFTRAQHLPLSASAHNV